MLLIEHSKLEGFFFLNCFSYEWNDLFHLFLQNLVFLVVSLRDLFTEFSGDSTCIPGFGICEVFVWAFGIQLCSRVQDVKTELDALIMKVPPGFSPFLCSDDIDLTLQLFCKETVQEIKGGIAIDKIERCDVVFQ